MGAVVVDGSVSPANWKKDKPKDYTGGTLDSALAAYEKLAGKKVSVPKDLPTMPKQSAKAFEDCVKEMESAIKELKAGASHLKDLGKALEAVNSAAKSTAAELKKLGDGKTAKDERKAYFDASATASAIASKAGESASEIK
jgi:exonuclease VII small subunit